MGLLLCYTYPPPHTHTTPATTTTTSSRPCTPETPCPHCACLVNCSLQGLAVRPRAGDATIFWSLRPDGTFDYKSLHGSCPVLRGEKWSATKWIHVGHYAAGDGPAVEVKRVIYAPPPPPVPKWCHDTRSECPMWAESGECEVNPGYMVGTHAQPGACLASCARCDLARKPAASNGSGGGAAQTVNAARRMAGMGT